MRSRMERYNDNTDLNDRSYSRTNKNSELYKNIGNNSKYTNFTDVSNINAIEINASTQNSRTRESYHKIKDYDNIMPVPKVKKELDEFNYIYQDRENKIYDINTVLEEARKNRIDKDELENKRKLKNTNYNILANLNPEELEKYRQRKNKVKRPSDDEIRELIDTITSKTLAGEISKATTVNLLSDLMATSAMDKIDCDNSDEVKEDVDIDLSLSKEILDKESIQKMNDMKHEPIKSGIMKDADDDFYTRSMDLSDKDFDIDDEFVEKSIPVFVKVLIILIILAVVGVAVYFIIGNF